MYGESRSTDYNEQVRDIGADKRGRVIPSLPLRKFVLDLTNARTAVEFKTSGDFIFLDRNSTGVINVSLRSPQEDQMPMGAFDIIENVPMDRIFISHAAQAGLVANIWYGYHARFRASSANLSTLGSITSTVNVLEQGGNYQASFQSNTGLAANTNETAVAPGSNVNGIRIFNLHGSSNVAAAAGVWGILAKAGAAPASLVDGDTLMSQGMNANALGPGLHIPGRLLVPSTRGLYRRTGAQADNGIVLWGVQYTLP